MILTMAASFDCNSLVGKIYEHRRLAYQRGGIGTETTVNDPDNDNTNNDIDMISTTSLFDVSDDSDSDDTFEQQQYHRRHTQQRMCFQQLLMEYQELKKYCPMTPLLWMYYAYDTLQLLKELSKEEDDDDEDTVQDMMEGDDEIDERNNGDNNNNNDQNKTNEDILSAYETASQIVKLGLAEFPGSAILHMFHVALLHETMKTSTSTSTSSSQQQQQTTREEVYYEALSNAIQQIGRGSHRSECAIVTRLTHLNVIQVLQSLPPNRNDTDPLPPQHSITALNVLLRCIRVNPCDSTHERWFQEYYVRLCQSHRLQPPSDVYKKIDDARTYESNYYAWMQRYEDAIQTAMKQEGIAMNSSNNNNNNNVGDMMMMMIPSDPFQDIISWDDLLRPNSTPFTCWNGRGGPKTAQAFIDYAQACFRYDCCNNHGSGHQQQQKHHQQDDLQQQQGQEDLQPQASASVQHDIRNLAVLIYERGVAECPTVEALWLSYLQHLSVLWRQHGRSGKCPRTNEKNTGDDITTTSTTSTTTTTTTTATTAENDELVSPYLSMAKWVVDRAIRNCPSSVALSQQHLSITSLQARQ
ncbi:hypothetical protein IV203_023785 [Nitzschia inconspicua]|uniref:Uncharacterized protein n=1 Tax=Nitzschia inconspicua TaxID=303405 RepID=A0A9K3PAF8_9STRA|nr:hypothetical protein IV203_023785 [Nitzschia inconspicua]